MHQPGGVGDDSAERGADGLQSDADAEDRDFSSEMADSFQADTGVLRFPGTWGNDDSFRHHFFDIRDCQLIVPDDNRVRANRSDKLVEVVDKAVVIINQ